jgi:hypothetical protein
MLFFRGKIIDKLLMNECGKTSSQDMFTSVAGSGGSISIPLS